VESETLTPRLLSQHEAATYLGISYWTLRDLNFQGDIAYVRIKRRILIDRADLDTYIGRSKIQHGA
jgi:excisionase family DNA binding protein